VTGAVSAPVSAPATRVVPAQADTELSPIDWGVAERVAIRTSGRTEFSRSQAAVSMPAEFRYLTETAQGLVEEYTGLCSLAGPAPAEVIDRPRWIRANIEAFRHVLDPLARKLTRRDDDVAVAPATAAARAGRAVSRRLLGVELGVLLGFLSQRVLGQYDLILPDNDGGIVYYVGPNIHQLENRLGFSPRDFRLWIALHEVTHRTQFTGVSWMRPYFLGLVDATLGAFDPDPRRFLDVVGDAVGRLRRGESIFGDDGVVGMFATPEQRRSLEKVQALMTLLEGHGNVVMDRVGAKHVRGQAEMSSALRQRRRQGGLAKIILRAFGMEMKVRQYEEGERFVGQVETARGPRGIDPAWSSSEALPTLEEIRGGASAWLARVDPAGSPGLGHG
jgi:coenzyme F420 biosynthesis associated uncharacterized protein